MSDSAIKAREASRHLNASLQFFKPLPNFPFELNIHANEWYTAPALRNNKPAVLSCQRACRFRTSGVLFALQGCSWFFKEGTTAWGVLGLDFVSTFLEDGDWGEEETEELLSVLMSRSSSPGSMSGTKCFLTHARPWNEKDHHTWDFYSSDNCKLHWNVYLPLRYTTKPPYTFPRRCMATASKPKWKDRKGHRANVRHQWLAPAMKCLQPDYATEKYFKKDWLGRCSVGLPYGNVFGSLLPL